MSVVEAAAMEVPVIVTKYPGPAGAMLDQINGYAIELYDVDAIVEKVSWLLRNPDIAKRFGVNGRVFAQENFDQIIYRKEYMRNRLELLEL